MSFLALACPIVTVKAAEVYGFIPELTRTQGVVAETKAWWIFTGERWTGTISHGFYDSVDLAGMELIIIFDSRVHKTTLNGVHEGTFEVKDSVTGETVFAGIVKGRMEGGNYIEGRWTQDSNTKGFYKGWKITPDITGTGEKWDVQFYSEGFDEYGYNYGSNLFVGPAYLYDRNPDYDFGYGYNDDLLVMKWSDNWEPGMNPTDNPELYMGAWVTNLWEGYADEDGDGIEEHYTYFVKIVYMGTTEHHYFGEPLIPGDPDFSPNGWYIWGYFVVVQEVWNDPSIGITGVQTLAARPALGGY